MTFSSISDIAVEIAIALLTSDRLLLLHLRFGIILQQMAYMLTIRDNQPVEESDRRWVGQTAAAFGSLVSGVAVLDASSSSKADTLNIFDLKTLKCDILDNNWDNKHVVFIVYFLKCIVSEVALLLIVILKTLTFHKV